MTLAQRIRIKTGDELEALADQFNDMAGRLQENPYTRLEQKVEERTREVERRARHSKWRASTELGDSSPVLDHELRTPLNAFLGLPR